VRRVVAQEGGQRSPVFMRIVGSLGVIQIIRPDLLEQLEDVDESPSEGVAPPVWGRGSLQRRKKKVECS
jgi:hypothetical protein